MTDMGWSQSPFLVPIAAFAAIFGVVAIRTLTRYKVRKLQSQERLLAIEKGQPLPPEPFGDDEVRPSKEKSAARRMANLRTAGLVCLALGVGLFLFFGMLAHVLDERDVWCGAAVGIIPMAIGLGLLVDVHIQGDSLQEPAASEPAAPPSQGNPPAGYLE